MLAKPSWSYARRALIVAGILAGAYLAWQLSAVLLLLFGAILVASLLSGAADLLVRHTFLNYRMALAAIALLLALLLGGLLVGFGAGIYMQFIPSPIDQNRWAQSRSPSDMIFHG
jgi:predicted PurR-regulated permease PerM